MYLEEKNRGFKTIGTVAPDCGAHPSHHHHENTHCTPTSVRTGACNQYYSLDIFIWYPAIGGKRLAVRSELPKALTFPQKVNRPPWSRIHILLQKHSREKLLVYSELPKTVKDILMSPHTSALAPTVFYHVIFHPLPSPILPQLL